MKTLLLFVFISFTLISFAGEVNSSRLKHAADSSRYKLNSTLFFGGGYTSFNGDFNQYQDGFNPFYFGVNLAFYRVNFNMNLYTGGNKLKKPLKTSNYSIPIDSTNFYGIMEFAFGYEILRTPNWQINPQIGFSTFQMGHTNQHVDENDSPIKANILLANDINYRFLKFKLKNGVIGFDLRYRLSWAPFKINSDIKGGFLNNQISVGIFGY